MRQVRKRAGHLDALESDDRRGNAVRLVILRHHLHLARARIREKASALSTYCLELEIPNIARKFGTVGLLGQDGGEAAHPKWKNAANLSRFITNAKDRLRSTRRRFEGEQRCATFEWAKKTRVSRKQRESMAAAAAAEGDEE